jgi:hypothetical protein
MITKEWIELNKKRKAYFKAHAPKNIKSLVMTKAWELYREELTKENYFTPKFKSSLQKAWSICKKDVYSEELKKDVRMFFDYDAPAKRERQFIDCYSPL